MGTSDDYRRKDPRRACDICGHEWHFSDLRYIGQNRWACPDDADGLTAEQIDAHNKRVRPLRIKPVKHPRPMTQNSDCLIDEARIFRLVIDFGTTAIGVSANGGLIAPETVPEGAPVSAAFSALYLAGIVDEDERPVSWIDAARVKLREAGDLLRRLQCGDPTSRFASRTIDDARYGALPSGPGPAVWRADNTALAGLALLRCYRILGDQAYLDAAVRCGHAMRNHQRCDAFAYAYTVDASGNRAYVGGWPYYVEEILQNLGSQFMTSYAVGMWFVKELIDEVGDDDLYGCPTATGNFIMPVAARLSTMLSEAMLFYCHATAVDGATGTAMAPLSMETPREFLSQYSVSPGYPPSSGNFELLDGAVSGDGFALALRSLYEVEGTSDRVVAMWKWLRSFTQDPELIALGYDYEPSYGLTDRMLVVDLDGNPAAVAGAAYVLGSAGWLAPLWVAMGEDFKDLKSELGKARRVFSARSIPDDTRIYANEAAAMWTGTDQEYTGYDTRKWLSNFRANGAAVLGMIYRYAPKSSPQRANGRY